MFGIVCISKTTSDGKSNQDEDDDDDDQSKDTGRDTYDSSSREFLDDFITIGDPSSSSRAFDGVFVRSQSTCFFRVTPETTGSSGAGCTGGGLIAKFEARSSVSTAKSATIVDETEWDSVASKTRSSVSIANVATIEFWLSAWNVGGIVATFDESAVRSGVGTRANTSSALANTSVQTSCSIVAITWSGLQLSADVGRDSGRSVGLNANVGRTAPSASSVSQSSARSAIGILVARRDDTSTIGQIAASIGDSEIGAN